MNATRSRQLTPALVGSSRLYSAAFSSCVNLSRTVKAKLVFPFCHSTFKLMGGAYVNTLIIGEIIVSMDQVSPSSRDLAHTPIRRKPWRFRTSTYPRTHFWFDKGLLASHTKMLRQCRNSSLHREGSPLQQNISHLYKTQSNLVLPTRRIFYFRTFFSSFVASHFA